MLKTLRVNLAIVIPFQDVARSVRVHLAGVRPFQDVARVLKTDSVHLTIVIPQDFARMNAEFVHATILLFVGRMV